MSPWSKQHSIRSESSAWTSDGWVLVMNYGSIIWATGSGQISTTCGSKMYLLDYLSIYSSSTFVEMTWPIYFVNYHLETPSYQILVLQKVLIVMHGTT